MRAPEKTRTRHWILFDGVCYLCSWVVRLVLAQDRSRRFVCWPLQSPEAETLIGSLPDGEGRETIILLTEGKVLTRSTAVLEIFKLLGGFWRLSAVLEMLPLSWQDWGYDRIAAIRYRLFGRREVCLRPPHRLHHVFQPPEGMWTAR